MEVSQEFVSKLERGGDPRISSITRYVNAMGGKVEIRVAIPKQKKVTLAIPARPGGSDKSVRQRRVVTAGS
jgi:hypothetical protein